MPGEPNPGLDPNANDAPPVDPEETPKPKVYDEAHVSGLNRENAEYRRKLRDTENKLKTFEDAQLSETEKWKKAADEAEAKITAAETKARNTAARADIFAAATKANLVDPDTAFQLLKDQVEFDDEGTPQNVEALVTQLAKDKPFLVAAGGTPAPEISPTNPPRRTPLTKEALEKMTPAQIAQLDWNLVQEALKSGR